MSLAIKDKINNIRSTYRQVNPSDEYHFNIVLGELTKERSMVEHMGVPVSFIDQNIARLGKVLVNNGEVYYPSSKIKGLVLLWKAKKENIESLF